MPIKRLIGVAQGILGSVVDGEDGDLHTNWRFGFSLKVFVLWFWVARCIKFYGLAFSL